MRNKNDLSKKLIRKNNLQIISSLLSCGPQAPSSLFPNSTNTQNCLCRPCKLNRDCHGSV